MQKAFAGAEITVCRLRADIRMMRERVGQRETGMNQARYLARIKSLEEELDRNPSEAFSVENQNRSITEVAREILQRARWM
jgi:hypothetical protein